MIRFVGIVQDIFTVVVSEQIRCLRFGEVMQLCKGQYLTAALIATGFVANRSAFKIGGSEGVIGFDQLNYLRKVNGLGSSFYLLKQ